MKSAGRSGRCLPLGFTLAGIFLAISVVMVPSISYANLLTYVCGAVIQSKVKTENTATSFVAITPGFVNVPGAAAVITVPEGKSRCVTVRFSAIASCSVTANNDLCQIQAIGPNGLLSPQTNNLNFVTEDGRKSARSFIWVLVLFPGTHTIRMRGEVGTAGTIFTIDEWTFEVVISAKT